MTTTGTILAALTFGGLLLQLGQIFYFIVLPILLLAGLGFYLQRKFGMDMSTLTRLNFYFVIPGLIYFSAVSCTLSLGEAGAVVLSTLLLMGCMAALTLVVARLRGIPRDQRNAMVMSTIFYNSGNYGMPLQSLASSAAGKSAAATALQSLVIITQNFTTFTLGIMLAASGRSDRHWKQNLLHVVKFPPVYALLAGLATVYIRRWIGDNPTVVSLAAPFWNSIVFIKDSFIAVALLTLGAQLAVVQPTKTRYPVKISVLLRLLAGPAIALVLIHLLGLRDFVAQTLLISASTPTAVNAMLLCMEFDNHPDFAARAVFYSTILSPLTITPVIFLAQGGVLPQFGPTVEVAWSVPSFVQTAQAEMPVSRSPLSPQAVSQPALAASDKTPAEQYSRLVYDLTDPNMEGRGPGTAGIERARDYLVEQYKAMGLQPAFGKNYTEAFPIVFGVHVITEVLSIGDANASPATKPAAPRPGRDFNVLGFSGSGEFNAPVVFAGYAITNKDANYDSLAGADGNALRGKVVVAFRYEPQASRKSLWSKGPNGGWSPHAGLTAKTDWVTRHGAAALLLVNPPAQESDPLRTVSQTSMGRAKIPVFHISAELFRQMLQAAGETDPNAAACKLEELADAGKCPPKPLGITACGQARLELLSGYIHNVAGVLPGKGALAGQVVIVGGHYDHLGLLNPTGPRIPSNIFSGADDNASGASGVIMLARWFAARAAAKDAPTSRRTLLFVDFSGEERGLLGSHYLVGHLGDANIRLSQVVAMINLDMIGRLTKDQLTVFGSDSSKSWPSILADVKTAVKVELGPVGPNWGNSDHASFFAASIPILFFHTGIHTDMHTVNDTPEKINMEGAIRVLHAAEVVLARVWTNSQAPAFVTPVAWMAGKPYLGVVLGKAADGGCPVDRVLDDGPAMRAGLKAGDVITAWNGEKIADSQALLSHLGQARPAQKVKFLVRRNTTSDEVEVILGQQAE